MLYLFVFSYCSWGSQVKDTEVICHSLLQWAMFYQPFNPSFLQKLNPSYLCFLEFDFSRLIVSACLTLLVWSVGISILFLSQVEYFLKKTIYHRYVFGTMGVSKSMNLQSNLGWKCKLFPILLFLIFLKHNFDHFILS